MSSTRVSPGFTISVVKIALLKDPLKKLEHTEVSSPTQMTTIRELVNLRATDPEPSGHLLKHQGQCVHTDPTQPETGKHNLSKCVFCIFHLR